MKTKLAILLIMVSLSACTDNARVRSFGGKEEIKLKPNEVLVGITWKEIDLWMHTKDTITGIDYFRERSALGFMEGEIVVRK